MKITNLRLENFKCFENLDLKLNKLTLLTGANSSGKSSIIYGLLSPFQSGEYPLKFSTNGKYVNMGDFEDMSYLHNKTNVIKIGYTIDNKSILNIDTFWTFDKQTKLPVLSKFIAKEEYYDLKFTKVDENKLVVEFEYNQEKDPFKSFNSIEFQRKFSLLISEIMKGDPKDNKNADAYLKHIESKFKKNNKKIKINIDSIDNLRNEIDKKGSYALSSIFQAVKRIFQELDQKMNYISSFRFNPEKIRHETSRADLRVGKYGDNYEDQILYWETKKDDKFQKLVLILKELGILQDIKTTRLSSGNYELKIKSHISSVYASLTDVGFGISQFLPIIVSDLQLGNGSTLFVSQPEIHLHPRIQSLFGEYLVDQIIKSKKNYVIETHSEYLINRIRLLIVQKKLKHEDVSIYYFQKSGNKVVKYELEFSIDGQIKNAPNVFFDTYMTDVLDIALNA